MVEFFYQCMHVDTSDRPAPPRSTMLPIVLVSQPETINESPSHPENILIEISSLGSLF